MNRIMALSCVSAVLACGGSTGVDTSSTSGNLHAQAGGGQPDPPMLGIHWARGQTRPGGSGGPDMTWHGGEIMNTAATTAIWWGTSSAASAGDKIAGIDSWYQGYGGSRYAQTTTEYTGTNGRVSPVTTHLGHIIDTSAAPAHSIRTSVINDEVCNALAASSISPVANGYYAVYVDTPRGHAGYCAWHSYGSCSGVPVQFAFFFNLDGDPGCDPQDASGLHSQGLAALANVSGHELAEAMTDPRNGGWYDSGGAENGDKCAWTFNGLVTVGTDKWLLQGEWSNNAYNNSSGVANSSGQKGCLY